MYLDRNLSWRQYRDIRLFLSQSRDEWKVGACHKRYILRYILAFAGGFTRVATSLNISETESFPEYSIAASIFSAYFFFL